MIYTYVHVYVRVVEDELNQIIIKAGIDEWAEFVVIEDKAMNICWRSYHDTLLSKIQIAAVDAIEAIEITY